MAAVVDLLELAMTEDQIRGMRQRITRQARELRRLNAAHRVLGLAFELQHHRHKIRVAALESRLRRAEAHGVCGSRWWAWWRHD